MSKDFKYTKEFLKEMQSLPLERKVGITASRIEEFYQHYDGNVFVSFSGGKDSTVLLYIARSLHPEIKGVFSNTGLEYPEIVKHVKTFENIDIIRPSIPFKQVLKKYGYPFISKEVSQHIRQKKQWNAVCGEINRMD